MKLLLLIFAALAFSASAQDHKPAGPVSTSIAIEGAVQNKLTLNVEELAKSFPVQRSQAYRGVRLRDILEKATIQAPDHFDTRKMAIIATASDGYKVVFSWSEIFNTPVGDTVLVLFEKDGAPLGDSEGRISLISAQDLRTGPRHVKWLRSLEVRKIVD
jgi:hypothetical protein